MTATLEGLVIAAFLAFCRVGACFMLMPGLSSIRVPLQVRLFIAIAASGALLMHLWEEILPFTDRNPDALALLVASEIMIGALIGLMARFYLLALQFMGTSVAMMVGYGGMPGPAIEEPEPQAALAAIISLSALILLFTLDFHHEIVRALVGSYSVLPVASLFDPRSALIDLTDTISESFLVMLRLGSPFIAYAIIVNVAIGFINKLTPQIPIYFVAMPFVIAGGLILIYFGVATLLSLFADGFVPVTVGR